MKNLIVYCHPNPKSFNHAILETYQEKLRNKDEEIVVRDLYDLNFEPILDGEDFSKFFSGEIPEDIKEEQKHIVWAEAITFIYPIWWFQMPAVLKGYIDRVFSKGFAYDLTEDGPVGLLSGKKVVIFNTTGGSQENYEKYGFKNALSTVHDIGIFGFCGMEVVRKEVFYEVPTVTDEERKEMLDRI